jgi:hypothetical protein
MQLTKLHYVVDIDIKGFFDNVDHAKLIKQMWTLGIQDKQLICIIGKMLKSPIEVGEMHCHHKIPKSKGGTDKYDNLIFISEDLHILIHATKTATIHQYLETLNLDENMINKVNKLRLLVGNEKLS